MKLYFVDDNGHVQTIENGKSCFLCEDDSVKIESDTISIIAWDGEIVGEYQLWNSLTELAKAIEE